MNIVRVWRGEVGKLAVPILIGMLPDSIASLVSMVVASRISSEALAGVGLASYFFFIVNAISSIFVTGLLVVLSQAHGAGRRDVVERAFSESLLLSILLSLLILATAPLWVRGYVSILSAGRAEYEAGIYLMSRLLSTPALMVNSVLAAAYRALEKPWPPSISAIVSATSSATLIPLLAFGYAEPLPRGIAGMGLASAISQYLGLSAYLFFEKPVRAKLCTFSKNSLKVLAIGVPASVERLVASIGQNVYINAVAKSGVSALAAHTIGINVESIVINPVFAISIASSARVGFHVGSKSSREVDSVARESLLIGISWMSIATAVLLAISPFVGRAFTENAEVAELVKFYLVYAAISEVGLGGSLAIQGVIRGMGNTWIPLVVNSLTITLLRAALAQVLQPVLGVHGVWFTQITDMYGRLFVSYAIYAKFKDKLVVRVS